MRKIFGSWKEIKIFLEMPRDRNELLRITLDKWRGERVFKRYSFRIWYKTPDGDMRPTNKGFTLKKKEMLSLVNALKGRYINIHGNTTKIMSD